MSGAVPAAAAAAHAAAGQSLAHRSSVHRVVTRRWVRRATPLWPFVWRGLLPALGLLGVAAYALAPFARHDIEAQVIHHTRQALDGTGSQWATATVSGQHVVLSGEPPSPAAAEAALRTAREVLCPTWAGPKVCAVDVRAAFAQLPPPVAAAPATTPAPAPAAATASAIQACEGELARLVERSRIEFATGKAAISERSGPLLDALAEAAKGCPGVLRIEGHTDSVGQHADNLALSQARAEAVRAALERRGIPAERLTTRGFGPDQPLASNDSAEGRARNRRIAFRVETSG